MHLLIKDGAEISMKEGRSMLHKCKLYVLVLLLLSSILMVSKVQGADNIAVAVNQSRVMNVYGVERVAIANPDIADVVVVSSSEVLVVGKVPGVTTLHIWSAGNLESYQVEVGADDIPIANEIKNILKFEDLTVNKIGKTIILEGKVNSQYQKARAEKVAGAYGEKVVNLLEITKPLQVKIEVVVLEIFKEKTNNLGITWSGNPILSSGSFLFGQSYTNPVGGGLPLGQLGGNYPINGQLSALIKNGAAKVLSQPSVITLSGENANIMVGGQIPIPIALDNGKITIEWKDYGIKLDIAPEVNIEGLINSKIKAEVSSLDWDSEHRIELVGNLKIPPIKMRKAETVIGLSSGQTMAIGGLIASETTKYVSKVPLLSDLPILGKLFTSTSFSKGETELVILITPIIVNPMEYMPQVTPEMKNFIKEDPLGGDYNGGKNKTSDR